jgi:Holliday junction resolvase RusA-like endonuclease
MTEQTFHLAFPPSANTMWRMRRGRYGMMLSEDYRAWKDEAGMQLMLQRPTKIEGPVRLRIGLNRAGKRKWDVDNRVKPLIDLLASHLVIEGDDYTIVKEFTAFHDPQIVGSGSHVTVTPVEA